MAPRSLSSRARSPKPIYVVYGPESFLRDQAIARIRELTVGADPDPLACSEFDGDAELAEVLDELRTLPMLAPYRLVVVKGGVR